MKEQILGYDVREMWYENQYDLIKRGRFKKMAHPVLAYWRGENSPNMAGAAPAAGPAASTGGTASVPDAVTGPVCPGTPRPLRTGAAGTERMRRYQTWGPPRPARPRRREEAVQGRAVVRSLRGSRGIAASVLGEGQIPRVRKSGKSRTPAERRQDPFDERPAERGALLPLMGRLPKGSAHEPQLRPRRAVRTQAATAWGQAGDTTFSPEPPLESRRGAGGCDRQAEKDPRQEGKVEREDCDPYLGISPPVHSFNAQVRENRMSQKNAVD